jgi:hypothetical protein
MHCILCSRPSNQNRPCGIYTSRENEFNPGDTSKLESSGLTSTLCTLQSTAVHRLSSRPQYAASLMYSEGGNGIRGIFVQHASSVKRGALLYLYLLPRASNILHCTALHCTAKHCTALSWIGEKKLLLAGESSDCPTLGSGQQVALSQVCLSVVC